MEITYKIFYFLSGIVFLISVLGSTLFKPMFDSISESTMEFSGMKKSYFQSADDKIDDLIYKSKQIEFQIEKLKKFFSNDKVDESKYQKENSRMVEKTFYAPLISMLGYVYRIGFFFLSLIILLFAIIFHLVYKSMRLRSRVRKLEEIVLTGT